jgi:hypothetical protein
MTTIAGWRIQVRPQFCDSDITTSVFINVRIADREAAIAAVRHREDAEMGEKIFALRPLSHEEVGTPEARVIPFSRQVIGFPRNKAVCS